MCIDLAVCAASLLLVSATQYRPLWNTDSVLLKHPLRQLLLAVALCVCWHFSLAAAGAYRSYRTAGWRLQAQSLARGVTLTAVWSCIWLSLSRWNAPIPPHSLLAEICLFWAFTFTGLLFTRVVARLVIGSLRRHGRNLRSVLIVGTNRRAVAVADQLLGNSNMGYRLAGFVDDFWYFDGAPQQYKQLLLGPSNDLLSLLRITALDEVIIALPIASHYHLTRQIAVWCRQQGILVRCEASLFDAPKKTRHDADSVPLLITLHDGNRDPLSAVVKRLVDLVVSGIALAAMMPLLGAIAIAIKITSPGPILFTQERVGLAKRRFRIYKFRTMVINAEALMKEVEHLNQSEGPTFKLKQDPRITPIGAFLRKTSLDELPQLFNVFLGNMSLVGPRPLPIRDYNGFSEDWHRRRFSVKPGITCLWQVSGRSAISFERWMELDMDYIDRWSLWLDFRILVETIPAVVRGSGAM